ncbi:MULTISPECIES: alanine racemase [Vagococcus]|uniref:Alanine racemase n=1 Tax=Vagococcus fluvialis bH819 TaxID=1255619 RepID=A0A1X6WQM5_9ENTE|nr:MULTISPECIES: alanine racemase [Vagococcus]SLM86604.1 Alanine racemase [Vagococcus fluvialis bH819]HCM90812.1 alanine racemase [Vagococcus sp.]
MIPSYHRPSKVIVDLDAIAFNLKNEKEKVGPSTDIFAVVKANGYGHGAIEVAKTAICAGASGLCVSNLDEALELRESGIQVPILVLSYVSLKYVPLAVEHQITLTATNLEWIQGLDDYLNGVLKIHLKIDTGMGRVGLTNPKEMMEAKKILTEHKWIDFEGIFTHMSKADSSDSHYFNQQKERFNDALLVLGKEVKYIHTSNSATALWHDAWESNLVRFGIAMYGLNPSGTELKPSFPLKQALTLETEIIHIKQMNDQEKIGYGATYEVKESEWIATLPIGYADGLRRSFQGFEVLVEGERYPIVGRICMDQLMIKVKHELPIGTKVTIFGLNDGLFNTIQSGAEYVDTINYEITCALTDRLPREYIK